MQGGPAGGAQGGFPRAAEGMALALFSTVLFSAGNAIIQHLSATIPPIEVVFFRSLFSFVILAPWVLHEGFASLKTKRLRLHLGRAAVQTLSMILFFQGLATVPLVEVNAFEFTVPIFTTIIAIVLLREKIRLRRTIALLVGFAGTMIALRPGFSEIGMGQLLLLSSSFVWGFVILAIRELGKTDSALAQNIYLAVVLTPIAFAGALLAGWIWPTWEDLVWLIAISLTATIGQMAYVQAFRLAEMSTLLPLDFAKLVLSAAIGLFFFAQVPNVYTVIGAVIIFASGAYITIREAQVSRRKAVPIPVPLEPDQG